MAYAVLTFNRTLRMLARWSRHVDTTQLKAVESPAFSRDMPALQQSMTFTSCLPRQSSTYIKQRSTDKANLMLFLFLFPRSVFVCTETWVLCASSTGVFVIHPGALFIRRPGVVVVCRRFNLGFTSFSSIAAALLALPSPR